MSVILTHGANSLNYNGGGSGLTLPYTLNINTFDVDTLTDRSVAYYNRTGYAEYAVSKDSNQIIITGSNQHSEFYLPLDQFDNLGDQYVVETTVDFPLMNFDYISTAGSGIQIGDGRYWNNLGFYYITTNLVTLNTYYGYSSSGWDVFHRYAGMPYSLPLTLKIIVDRVQKKVSTYYNDVLVADITYSDDPYIKQPALSFYNDSSGAWFNIKGIKIYNV